MPPGGGTDQFHNPPLLIFAKDFHRNNFSHDADPIRGEQEN
jgi:hypothetical protein